VIGIVNVTPDSFYDGGKAFSEQDSIDQAQALLQDGADVIDLGGESTRPFSSPVSVQEELGRITPAVDFLRTRFPHVPLSVDTTKAAVARRVLEKGAAIVNDVSACGFDPELLDVLADFKPGYVLMHSQGRPEDMQKNPSYQDVVGEIKAFFESRLTMLTRAGLPEDRIVLDPGIGFGKRLEHNLAILEHIDRFFDLGRPLYIGLSNKSMWKKLLGLGAGERQTATQVATALMASKGVRMHRVHEVRLTVQTLKIVQAVEPQEERNAVSS
jgi:dihydropteroate synthase